MRLLQVVLAAGIFANLVVAGPLFDYDDDYDYDENYYDNWEDAAPLEEPAADAEPEPDASGGGHHHHHHHPPAPAPDVAVVADGGDEALPKDILLAELEAEDLQDITAEFEEESNSATESSEELPKVAVHSVIPTHKIPSNEDGASPSPAPDAPKVIDVSSSPAVGVPAPHTSIDGEEVTEGGHNNRASSAPPSTAPAAETIDASFLPAVDVLARIESSASIDIEEHTEGGHINRASSAPPPTTPAPEIIDVSFSPAVDVPAHIETSISTDGEEATEGGHINRSSSAPVPITAAPEIIDVFSSVAEIIAHLESTTSTGNEDTEVGPINRASSAPPPTTPAPEIIDVSSSVAVETTSHIELTTSIDEEVTEGGHINRSSRAPSPAPPASQIIDQSSSPAVEITTHIESTTSIDDEVTEGDHINSSRSAAPTSPPPVIIDVFSSPAVEVSGRTELSTSIDDEVTEDHINRSRSAPLPAPPAPPLLELRNTSSTQMPTTYPATTSTTTTSITTTSTTTTTTTAFKPVLPDEKSCSHAPDPGVCRGHFPMFYFDAATRTCLQFVYGGCRGNSNAFRTASECYAKCHPVGFTRGAGKGDDYLKLHKGRGDRTFTFPSHDAALRVEDATLVDFSVRNVYQLEFSFRTDSPHGLIAFLRQTSVPPEVGNRRVQLYVFLRRGHLGVTHIFCHNRETFLMNKGGLQAGNWHSSLVKINSGTGELLLEVDGFQETFTITSLRDQPHYGSHESGAFTSRLWIGGVYEEEVRQEAMVERTANFHGCLKKVALMSGKTSEEIVWHKGLRSSTFRGVKERCRTNCNDRSRNLCSPNSDCVEHFDHSTCSCFGSGLDGRRCTNHDIPILTLSNDGHVVHRLYEWMDRVHTYTNFISLEFRTRFTDSILFYGSSQYPEKQYIAASLTAAGSVFVEANLGGGAVNIEVGERLQTGTWHTLTLVHQHNRIQVYLNSRLHDTLIVPGEVRYFHLDPEFYFGSAPNLTRTCGLRHDGGIREGYSCQDNQRRYYYDVHDAECHSFNYSGCGGNGNNFPDHHTCMDTCNYQGLRSMHSFLGCMRNVFINDASVLWELKVQNKTTRYVGATEVTPFTDTCKDRDQMVLMTLSTEKAHVNLTNPDPENFRLVVSFRPTKPRGVVASGYVDILDSRSVWEIHHDENHVSFVIQDDQLIVKPNTKISIGNWQFVDVSYRNGKVVMRVNQKTVSNNPPGPLTFFPSVTLGLSPLQEYPGMVGSVRKLELGGQRVELRSLVGTDVAQKNVIYDGGRVLGPCERPGSCEHGGTCTLDDNDEIRCDCTDSGYTGKTCHFSLYKTSCEQYRHIGYNTSGVYKIDVDGNGPLPPSFVRCDFNHLTGVTSTIVENNLPQRYEVRGPGLGNVELQVQYRDFTPEMLQALVTKAESCTQKVKYDCRRSPLKLSTHTWFSSPSQPYISSFGSQVPGLCRCKEIEACDEPDVACNCDAVDGLARFDKAVISDPNLLPLTSMFFLEDKKGMREESEGRISLGPLTCTKEATVEQTASFSKDGVYLEVPAWREGSLFLSFKTTSTRATIAYQPAYHPSHATFRIALLGEKEVEFMYSFHGLEHRHSLHTTRSLNTGEWQQVTINIHHAQLRFLVNSEQKLIDIEDNAHLGVLDGSMFLGGMPPKQPSWMNQEMEEEEKLGSLKGCIRDLTLNDELVDLARYVRAAPLGVSSSCKPSCDPNPCKNGAECIESWGSYKCVCKNPLAHSGINCENNINEDAVTFPTQESKLKYFVNDTAEMGTDNLLNTTSLFLNFRTNARQGLILFTYDYLHNFLQLHLASPNQLVLLFNSGKQAVSLTVETTGEVVLNKGQSVQVALERDNSSTILSVFTSGAFFNASVDSGLLLLEDMDYEQFPFGESTPLPGMVDYPHSFTKPSPFFMVYVGSADDSRWDVESEVLGFVGCVRGLQVNSEPLSLRRLLSEHPAPGVKKDCYMMCDAQPCLNGGTCSEDFEYPTNFYCNCSGTSYTGPVCSTETAYIFSGNQWLSRDAATSPLMENLVLELAFSSSVRRPQHQVVAFLRSTSSSSPDDYILVAVESDGAVVVRALLESLKRDTTLVARASPAEGINAFSGNRHIVRVEWMSSGLRVTIDREEHVIQEDEEATYRDEVSTSPRSLYLGGVGEGVDSRLLDYDNFHGCISNVMISTQAGKVYPLLEYNENDLHITNYGLPQYGSCAGFPVQPAMVLMYRASKALSSVKGEDWSVRAAQRMPYAAPPPMESAKRDTPMDNVVPAVAASVLLVTGVIVGILCLQSNSKKKKKAKQAQIKKEEEEREALLKERKKSREEAMKTRITATTDVEMATVKAAVNGGTPVQDKVMTMNEVNQQKAPPMEPPKEPPPPIPSEEPEEGEVEVRTPKETTGDRPLSWDKSADTLPLIIGTQMKPQEEAEDSTSEGSSFDCTIDITGSPSSSAVFPPQSDLGVGVPDSPSSMRVNRGSNTMVYIDEDTDAESEPRLLRHGSLPDEDEPEEVVEPPFVETKVQLLGDGEVQKIVKSEDEDEIVVVDDYLEDKAATTAKPENVEDDLEKGNQLEPSISQQKENDLVEAAQESTQIPSETEEKIDQAIESATEEQESAKETEGKETDNNQPEQKEKEIDEQHSLEVKAEGEEKKENVDSGKLGDNEKKLSSDSDSDNGFIELRPESEKVQDSERETSQTWQEPKSPPTDTPREDDEKIPREKLPTQKDNDNNTASEKTDAKKMTSDEFKMDKTEDDAVEKDYSEGEKDAGKSSEMPGNDQEIELRRNEEMEAKEGKGNEEDEVGRKISPFDQQEDSEGSVPPPSVPEIFVSSPKEEQNLEKGYSFIQIYKPKEGEGKGEAEGQYTQIPEYEVQEVEGLESSHREETSYKNADGKISNITNDDANNTNIKMEEDNAKEDNAANASESEEYETVDQDDAYLSTSKENDDLLDITSKLLLLDMAGQSESQSSPPGSCPGSPLSDGDRPESPTYVNLFHGDDLRVVEASPRCSPGSLTPLDPISEQDESDEEKEKDENESTRKISMPTLFQSKFSSGITNLSELPGDENAAQEQSTSEGEAEEDTKDEPDAAPDVVPDVGPDAAPESPSEPVTEPATEPTPEPATEPLNKAAEKGEAGGSTKKRKRRRKKGHVTGEKQTPIYLAGGVRTFSNPISYFGGPNIEYEEEEGDGGGGGGGGGGRQRNDSIVSTTSLD